MTAAFAVTTWENTQPIDLRTRPAQMQTSIDAVLERFASTPASPDATRYLPEDFLTILIG